MKTLPSAMMALTSTVGVSIGLTFSTSAAQFVDLGGPASGYVAAFNFKNSGTQNGIEGKDTDGNFNPNHNGLPDYPNFQIPVGFTNAGVYTAIITSPLAAGADYSAISADFYGGAPITINNQVNSQADFSTLSAGRIDFDNALVTGVGTEIVPVTALTFDFNTFEWDGVVDAEPRSNFTLANPAPPIMISPFSPVYTEFNDGSGSGNAQLFYLISIDNVSGTGLTFQDGDLVSMDFTGDLSISGFVAPFAGFGSLDYTGTFSASGLGYAFDVTGTDSLAFFSGVNLLANRTGTAALVPEPAAAILVVAGVTCCLGRRRG